MYNDSNIIMCVSEKGTDTVGRLVSVSISGCKENDVCAVPIGSNVTLTIKFNACKHCYKASSFKTVVSENYVKYSVLNILLSSFQTK